MRPATGLQAVYRGAGDGLEPGGLGGNAADRRAWPEWRELRAPGPCAMGLSSRLPGGHEPQDHATCDPPSPSHTVTQSQDHAPWDPPSPSHGTHLVPVMGPT